jgi:hypothetical protein
MRRNAKTPNVYAWYVDSKGQIRSERLGAGLDHPFIVYEGNVAQDGFDHGRFDWYIDTKAAIRRNPAAKDNPPISLLDAYKQDCRPELSREIDAKVQGRNGKYPWGFVTYMRWVVAGEQGARRHVEQDTDREGNDFAPEGPLQDHRKVPAEFPFDGRPEISIRRIKRIDVEDFDFPEFQSIDFTGVDRAEASVQGSEQRADHDPGRNRKRGKKPA